MMKDATYRNNGYQLPGICTSLVFLSMFMPRLKTIHPTAIPVNKASSQVTTIGNKRPYLLFNEYNDHMLKIAGMLMSSSKGIDLCFNAVIPLLIK